MPWKKGWEVISSSLSRSAGFVFNRAIESKRERGDLTLNKVLGGLRDVAAGRPRNLPSNNLRMERNKEKYILTHDLLVPVIERGPSKEHFKHDGSQGPPVGSLLSREKHTNPLGYHSPGCCKCSVESQELDILECRRRCRRCEDS